MIYIFNLSDICDIFVKFTMNNCIVWRCYQSTGRPWTADLYKSVRPLYSLEFIGQAILAW